MRGERRFRRPSGLATLGHGLLCLFLLLGALDLHLEADALEPLSPGESSVYHPGADHPGQPVHIEPADPVQQPHCAACLHRLETRGAHLVPAFSALPVILTSRLIPPPAPNASRVARASSGARAPPLS